MKVFQQMKKHEWCFCARKENAWCLDMVKIGFSILVLIFVACGVFISLDDMHVHFQDP